jgi:chromosomal replication initiation ATPase DnaA
MLGSVEFIEKMKAILKGTRLEREVPWKRQIGGEFNLQQIIAAVEQVRGESWEEFRDRHGDWGRDLVIMLARKRCGLPLAKIGEALGGLDYAAVAVASKRMQSKALKNKQVKAALQRVENKLKC